MEKIYYPLSEKMSAFGTKKRGADFAQQLTFPAVFSEYVEKEGVNPFGYYPASQRNPVILPVGDDLQDKYHEQKRIDANRRVMNAVADNRASTSRFLKSHQNYDLPKPVLSQRQFANPSNGNQADIYSHRPVQWEVNWDNMVGGVLFTQEAQKWGRQKLRDRIGQLDAIQQAKQEFLTGTPMVDATAGVPSGVEGFPAGSMVELVALLQTIQSAVEEGKVSALTVSDSVKFLRLLFRWATTASVDELKEVYNYLEGDPDGLVVMVEALEDEFSEGVAEGDPQVRAYNGQLLETLRKIVRYLDVMIKNVNKSPKERKNVSENAVKTLGFTSILKTPVRVEQQTEERLRQRARELARPADIRWISSSVFSEPPSRFSAEPREALARSSGDWFGSSSSSSSSSTADPFRDSRPSAELPIAEAEAKEASFPDVEAEGKDEAVIAPPEAPRLSYREMVLARIQADGIGNRTKDELRSDASALGVNSKWNKRELRDAGMDESLSGKQKSVNILRRQIQDRVRELTA